MEKIEDKKFNTLLFHQEEIKILIDGKINNKFQGIHKNVQELKKNKEEK